MSNVRLEKEVSRVRERYAQLWTAIIRRHGLEQERRGESPPLQSALAEKLKVAPAAISRLIHGKGLPRSFELLINVAQSYGATPEEIRVLLVWANVIAADDASEDAVVEHFLAMFRPLYGEEALARRIIRPAQVAYNVLLDLGVPRTVADRVAESVRDCQSRQETIGRVMLHDDPGLQKALAAASHEQIVSLFKTYSHVAVIDFDGPFTEFSPVLSLRHAQRRGDCEPPKVWKDIKHLVITRIKVRAGRSVPDVRHEGVEFVFLEAGSGMLEIKGVGEVKMDEKTRRFIAYRPTGPHSFTAGDTDAVLYVISYSRPGENEDPTDDLLAAASEPRIG